ncbi:MAG: PIN domain-containing protein [Acidimicrobiales bacterium]
MTRLLLDTTYLIDADREPDALDETIGDSDDVAIAAVTVAELLVGVELSAGRARAARQRFVDDVRANIPVISYDAGVAVRHAMLLVHTRREGRPRGAHDLLIAATAAASERDVVSADESAFEGLPGVVLRSHR